MRVLIDTDVLLDVALDRDPFAESACRLLDYLQLRPGDGMLAWHSVSNFYYLVRSSHGDGTTHEFIADLLKFLRVVAGDTDAVRSALGLPMSDFEDALQAVSARMGKADRIVTRNIVDYRRSPVPASSPTDIINELGL